jgi:hypothetical protein
MPIYDFFLGAPQKETTTPPPAPVDQIDQDSVPKKRKRAPKKPLVVKQKPVKAKVITPEIVKDTKAPVEDSQVEEVVVEKEEEEEEEEVKTLEINDTPPSSPEPAAPAPDKIIEETLPERPKTPRMPAENPNEPPAWFTHYLDEKRKRKIKTQKIPPELQAQLDATINAKLGRNKEKIVKFSKKDSDSENEDEEETLPSSSLVKKRKQEPPSPTSVDKYIDNSKNQMNKLYRQIHCR